MRKSLKKIDIHIFKTFILKLHFDCTDGRVKLWVYAVTVVGFILILFIIALSFLVWYVLNYFLKRFLTTHNFAAFKNKSSIVGHTRCRWVQTEHWEAKKIPNQLLSLNRTLSSLSYTPHNILSAVCCCCYQIIEFFVKSKIKLGCCGTESDTLSAFLSCLCFLFFFFFSKPSKTTKTSPPQKPLTLAYDGDMDM